MKSVLVLADSPALGADLDAANVRLGGVRVFHTRLPGEVAKLLLAHDPDVLLLDLNTVDVSALEMLAILDGQPRPPPTVISSSRFGSGKNRQGWLRLVPHGLSPSNLALVCIEANRCRAESVKLSDYLSAAQLTRAAATIGVFDGEDDVGTLELSEGEIWSASCGLLKGGAATQALLARVGPHVRISVKGREPLVAELSPPSLRRVESRPPPVVAHPMFNTPPVEASRPIPQQSQAAKGRGLIGAAGLLAIGIVATAFILRPHLREETGAVVAAPQHVGVANKSEKAERETALRARATALLTRATSQLKAQRFVATTELLDGLDGTQLTADQFILANTLRCDAQVGQQLALAEQGLVAGELEATRTALNNVLLRRPSEGQALLMLARLRAAREAKEVPPPEKVVSTVVPPKKTRREQRRTRSKVRRVDFRSVPPALVVVDGQPVGYSPLYKHRLREGEHRIELRREGYQTLVRSIHVSRAMGTQTFVLQPDRQPPPRVDVVLPTALTKSKPVPKPAVEKPVLLAKADMQSPLEAAPNTSRVQVVQPAVAAQSTDPDADEATERVRLQRAIRRARRR